RKERKNALEVARPIPPAWGRIGAHLEILHHGQGGKDLSPFRDVRDSEVGALRWRNGQKIAVLEPNDAGGWTHGAGYRLEERGLAGTVGADDRDELSLADRQGHSGERRKTPISNGESLNCEHGSLPISGRDTPR